MALSGQIVEESKMKVLKTVVALCLSMAGSTLRAEVDEVEIKNLVRFVLSRS